MNKANEASADAAAVIDNRVFTLILQHPRERDNPLATAELLPALLRHARLVVGLSWPNLVHALGAQALGHEAQSGEWAVLHLGAAHPQTLGLAREIAVLDRHGEPVEGRTALAGIRGIVLLDGTWKEAKTLWWRNPWLLKLRRIVLNPRQRAHYGRVRREPRPQALSTLEAAALALRHLEARPDIERALLDHLDRLIATAPRRPHGRVRR
jgi:DTW domain-containing protein YfiP